jgi:hypothetical protein
MNRMLSLSIAAPLRRLEAALPRKVARAEAAMKPHVNRAVLGLGLAYPIATLPQLYNVWVLGRTGGLSEVTYGAGCVMALTWTLYGIINRDRAIWMVNVVWIGLHTAMFIGLMRGA